MFGIFLLATLEEAFCRELFVLEIYKFLESVYYNIWRILYFKYVPEEVGVLFFKS